VPGIPLERVIPAWYPVREPLSYFCGAVLLVAGLAMLTRRWARSAAIWVGALMVVLTVLFYAPLLFTTMYSGLTEGANFVFDTLLFGATVLLVAMALPDRTVSGA
jgi:uncharacterized membrane protein YphA (DoxX/SURF4 family)